MNIQKIMSKVKTYEEALEEVEEEEIRAFARANGRNWHIKQHGETKGRLLFALKAISEIYEEGEALDPEDMSALAEAARRYINGRDRYPGEYGGSDMLMQKRDSFGKSSRNGAIYSLIEERRTNPSTPLDKETYERVAHKHGMSRASLEREVKKRRAEKMIAKSHDGHLRFDTLGDLLKKNSH